MRLGKLVLPIAVAAFVAWMSIAAPRAHSVSFQTPGALATQAR